MCVLIKMVYPVWRMDWRGRHRMRVCSWDHCGHKNEGLPGDMAMSLGKERGRAMEKQILGELNRTCDR